MKLKDVIKKEIIPLIGKRSVLGLFIFIIHRRIDLKCILFYRLAIICKQKKIYFLPVFFYNKLITNFNCYISLSSKIGEGLRFPHPSSIIIGKGVIVGDNAIIYQNVTIGASKIGDVAKNRYPKIGNNVTLYTGSSIIGDVKLGNNVVVGAHSLVTQSFPDNSIIVGIPARKIN